TTVSNTKIYDATTVAATPSVSGLKGNDTVTGLSESYDTKNVGAGKLITLNSGYIVNDGNNGANYTITTIATNTAGAINKASLTIAAVTKTKVYDGTTVAAALPTISGLRGNDTVT